MKENQANQPSYVRELRERFKCDDNALVPRNTPKNDLNPKKFFLSPFLIKYLTEAWEFQRIAERSVSEKFSKPKTGKR